MRTYHFEVGLCGGWTGGCIEIKANNYHEAHDKAISEVGERLYKAFPELEIDYEVICEEDLCDEEVGGKYED